MSVAAIPDRPADLVVAVRPFSKNDTHEGDRKGGKRRTKAYDAWLREAADTAAYCRAGDKMPGAYAMRLTVPANRLDLGNVETAISDALQAGTVIGNDRLSERIEIVRDRARNEATVLVELWSLV